MRHFQGENQYFWTLSKSAPKVVPMTDTKNG